MSLDCDYEEMEGQREEETEEERLFREKCEAAGFNCRTPIKDLIFEIILRLKALEEKSLS